MARSKLVGTFTANLLHALAAKYAFCLTARRLTKCRLSMCSPLTGTEGSNELMTLAARYAFRFRRIRLLSGGLLLLLMRRPRLLSSGLLLLPPRRWLNATLLSDCLEPLRLGRAKSCCASNHIENFVSRS